MRKPITILLAANLCVGLLAGCGEKPQPANPPPSKPSPAVAPSAPVPAVSAPAEVAPPPPPSGASPAAAVSASPAGKMVDAEGKAITALQHLQLVVDQYDRLRPGSGGDDQHPPWPPLTDLSQLVKVKLVKSLPQAPPGQKFVLDPNTLKVSVVSQ